MGPAAEAFRAAGGPAGIFLDFDGSLSEIAARPELATIAPSVRPILRRLARDHALVAVVSGRPSERVRALIGLPEVPVFGLYGLEATAEPRGGVGPAIRGEAERAAARVPGARIEDKALSVAVHYREAEDPAEAERILAPELMAVARRHGLALLPGKMVLELAPASTPGKGFVILREARARGLTRCLFAGDDLADLDAFAALDELRREGVHTAKVAVRSAEAPPELVGAADVVVEGPAGLVRLLAEL